MGAGLPAMAFFQAVFLYLNDCHRGQARTVLAMWLVCGALDVFGGGFGVDDERVGVVEVGA